MIESRCGLLCGECGYKESCGCGGCIETNGHPFHGECPVAVCCQNKGFVHCGECPDIPCELLTQYSCDPEHGDTPHGARIEQCKRWAGIMKLDGFGIFANDLAAQIKFYQEVLGFEIKQTAEDRNVYLEKDGTLFLMYGRGDFENMTSSKFSYADGINGHFEIALGVENHAAVDKTFAEVTAKGAKPVMPPTTMPWGQRTCYISDPEGNLIEIGSFVK